MDTCIPAKGAEPSCPKCGHYNAMLQHRGGVGGKPEIRKCRDCGHEAALAR
jgi:DNA-directed RNA polymerase subunit M/transcription elongation factor TFIIS